MSRQRLLLTLAVIAATMAALYMLRSNQDGLCLGPLSLTSNRMPLVRMARLRNREGRRAIHDMNRLNNTRPRMLRNTTEQQIEYQAHQWAKERFLSYWNNTSHHSCVEVCNKKKLPSISFKLPKKQKCTQDIYCTYGRLSLHSTKVYKTSTKVSAVCGKDNTVSCPRGTRRDCSGFSWTSKEVSLHTPSKRITQNILDLIIRNPRSFRVQSSLVSHIPKYLVMVAFYLPNTLYADKCNQVYCIYSDMKTKEFEVKIARPGDASFAYCPRPTIKVTNSTIVQLAYRPDIMSYPSPLVIQYPVSSLPYVKLSICTIVRKEGENLVEWIEFHRMMGYERFILYDNNPTNEPDSLMEKIISHYDGIVIRRHWKVPHSQTEAYTDCINRYKRNTKWLSLIDVDEFIVPNPKYRDVLSVLEGVYKRSSYIHINWLTFGPCGEKSREANDLMMELCHYTTKPSSNYPKSTIKAEMAAGMQNYGPHYVRMKRDIGGQVASISKETTLLVNYHYRYRTYPEFMERRKGPRAARALTRSREELVKEWKDGIKYSSPLSEDDNWILRYHKELKERVKKVNALLNK